MVEIGGTAGGGSGESWSIVRDENGKRSTSRLVGLLLTGTLCILALAGLYFEHAPEYIYKTFSSILLALAANWAIRGSIKNQKGE